MIIPFPTSTTSSSPSPVNQSLDVIGLRALLKTTTEELQRVRDELAADPSRCAHLPAQLEEELIAAFDEAQAVVDLIAEHTPERGDHE